MDAANNFRYPAFINVNKAMTALWQSFGGSKPEWNIMLS